MTEGKALKDDEEAYYIMLTRLLDVVLVFTEQGKFSFFPLTSPD